MLKKNSHGLIDQLHFCQMQPLVVSTTPMDLKQILDFGFWIEIIGTIEVNWDPWILYVEISKSLSDGFLYVYGSVGSTIHWGVGKTFERNGEIP